MGDRQSIRQPGHDYAAPGMYFVTVCTRNRQPLLGRWEDGAVILSPFGAVVGEEWRALADRFPTVRFDDFAVMPNHLHGIITLVGAGLAPAQPAARLGGLNGDDGNPTGYARGWAGASPAPTLGDVVGAFKSLSDRRCREVSSVSHPGRRFGHLWQRGYHDHVVADLDQLAAVRAYIRNNARTWHP